MGSWISRDEPLLEDWNARNIGYSFTAGTSHWDKYEKPKNYEFYFGKERFFKVSRRHYPQYTDGYIWGRYEDKNYYNDIDGSYKQEEETDGEIYREF